MVSSHLREKKGNYYVEFRNPRRQPVRKWVTLRTKDKSVARQRFAQLERDEAMGNYDPWEEPAPQHGLSVEEGLKEFLEQGRKDGKREKTLDNYKYTLGAFARSLSSNFLLEHVREEHIREYISDDTLSPTSQHTYYRQLRAFFNWCEEEGLVENNPIDAVKEPHKPRKQPAFLKPDQVEHLIQVIRKDAENNKFLREGAVVWLADVIQFAYHTALRRGEICDLRWSAVNLETGFLTIRGTDNFQTKSGHEDRVPIIGKAEDVLKKWKERRTGSNPKEYVFKGVRGGGLSPNYVSERFRDYRKKAELPEGIHFHSLRHSCAAQLAMEGKSMRIVQEMLRHASPDTVQIYAHLSPDRFRNHIEDAFENGRN